MATWTPTDLTYPEFVNTKLTPLDRSNALLSMNNSINSIQSALERNQEALAAAQALTNGPLSFGTIRDARRAAQEAQAAGAPNAAELQSKFEELQAQRSIQTANADKFLRNVQTGEEALRTAQLAVNNLERAGAVPPGTNQFTPPPGYTGSINPPQQVPDSQNPNPTPTSTASDENIQNSSPASINPNIDPNTNIGAEGQPPLTKPETTESYQADPTTQTFDDGSSIQTFDDGSTLVTDTEGNVRGLPGAINEARSTATAQDTANFETKQDWRVRLSLAPSATYLYKAENPGILKPLKDTDGVIFPYLPSVTVSYMANYDPQDLTHSNYKAYQYRNSSVEQVQITGDFTAQDTAEANYMLAVIHFFRSVTKMFYGQDQNPKPGTPPPLVFLYGLGDFQFNAHPLVVTTFNYSLPNDVDYIRASAPTLPAGVSTAGYTTASNSTSPTNIRLNNSGLNTGATAPPPQFQTNSNSQPTYVPTKMQIQITALPMVTRNDISNNFSLKQYATGALLRGTQNKRAGIW